MAPAIWDALMSAETPQCLGQDGTGRVWTQTPRQLVCLRYFAGFNLFTFHTSIASNSFESLGPRPIDMGVLHRTISTCIHMWLYEFRGQKSHSPGALAYACCVLCFHVPELTAVVLVLHNLLNLND